MSVSSQVSHQSARRQCNRNASGDTKKENRQQNVDDDRHEGEQQCSGFGEDEHLSTGAGHETADVGYADVMAVLVILKYRPDDRTAELVRNRYQRLVIDIVPLAQEPHAIMAIRFRAVGIVIDILDGNAVSV